MAFYEMTPNCLRAIPPTTFSRAGIRERADLQRLLREQINIVAGEAVDIVPAEKQLFEQRGGILLTRFDEQVNAIQQAGYPASLDCGIVESLSASRAFLAPREIERVVFP